MDFKTDSDRVAYNSYCVSVCRRENKTYFSDLKISDRTDNKTFFIKEKPLFPGKVNSLIKITLVENKEKMLTEIKITSEIRTVISYEKIVETFKNPFCEYFFNCYLAAPRPFGPLSRGQPHSPDVNHCVLHFRLGGHQEPRSEVRSLSPAVRLVGFEPGTFRFLLQRLNPLGHSLLYSSLSSNFAQTKS